MNIYIHSISYLPRTLSGAVRYNHEMAKLFISWGHDVRVLVDQIKEPYEVDGVNVVPFTEHERLMRWADVVIVEPARFRLCKSHHNVIVMQHTERPATYNFENAKVIYCGYHVSAACNYKCKGSMVLYPFNRYKDVNHKPSKDGYILLINCNSNKGGTVLYHLARSMPHLQFRGVKGDYGVQLTVPLPNLSFFETQVNLSEIYKGASILIIPSVSEGLPTVAMEAMAHGIPVTGWDIGGVVEVIGGAAPLPTRRAVPMLKTTIEKILNEYPHYSAMAKLRANDIEVKREDMFEELKAFI